MRSITPRSRSSIVRHPRPAAREQRGHDHHAGSEEGQVVVAGEAGDVDDLLEQGPEQQQPDDRLHEGHDDPPGLAQEGAHVANGLVAGIAREVDGGGHRFSSFSAASNVRPA
jgi:hypothetical protein